MFQKFVPIVICILSKAFNTSLGKCKLNQVRNLSKKPFKAISNQIWRNYDLFSFLPNCTRTRGFSRHAFPSHFVGFLFWYFNCFLFFSLYPFMKMKTYTVCARAQASIFMVFWPISEKKRNCQIVEDVWTMTKQVVKIKDLRRQTKEWMAFFSQNVWEILSKKL